VGQEHNYAAFDNNYTDSENAEENHSEIGDKEPLKAAGNVSVSAKTKFMANICVQSARRRRNGAWRPWPQALAMPKKTDLQTPGTVKVMPIRITNAKIYFSHFREYQILLAK